MGVERDVLEQMAMEAVSAEMYYDLLDNIKEMDDFELMKIVKDENPDPVEL